MVSVVFVAVLRQQSMSRLLPISPESSARLCLCVGTKKPVMSFCRVVWRVLWILLLDGLRHDLLHQDSIYFYRRDCWRWILSLLHVRVCWLLACERLPRLIQHDCLTGRVVVVVVVDRRFSTMFSSIGTVLIVDCHRRACWWWILSLLSVRVCLILVFERLSHLLQQRLLNKKSCCCRHIPYMAHTNRESFLFQYSRDLTINLQRGGYNVQSGTIVTFVPAPISFALSKKRWFTRAGHQLSKDGFRCFCLCLLDCCREKGNLFCFAHDCLMIAVVVVHR